MAVKAVCLPRRLTQTLAVGRIEWCICLLIHTNFPLYPLHRWCLLHLNMLWLPVAVLELWLTVYGVLAAQCVRLALLHYRSLHSHQYWMLLWGFDELACKVQSCLFSSLYGM